MAALSQTAANVALAANSNAVLRKVKYGEAITQGNPIYQKAADSLYYQCDANTQAEAASLGIALTPGASGDDGVMAVPGSTVDLGATLTVGETYVVGATAGSIHPIGDIASGWFVTILGTATATDSIPLNINQGTVVKP